MIHDTTVWKLKYNYMLVYRIGTDYLLIMGEALYNILALREKISHSCRIRIIPCSSKEKVIQISSFPAAIPVVSILEVEALLLIQDRWDIQQSSADTRLARLGLLLVVNMIVVSMVRSMVTGRHRC